MSDELTAQELQDVEKAERLAEALDVMDAKPNWPFEMAMSYVSHRDQQYSLLECARAAGRYMERLETKHGDAIRTIDRLTADLDRLRLDYEHLQAVNRQIANERDEAMRREEHNAKVIQSAAHPLTIQRLIEALETFTAFSAQVDKEAARNPLSTQPDESAYADFEAEERAHADAHCSHCGSPWAGCDCDFSAESD